VKTVRMTHPEAGDTEVPASAVPHWRAPVQDSEVKTSLEPQGEEAPPKRRRAKEGE
jgi:hypothetical protein